MQIKLKHLYYTEALQNVTMTPIIDIQEFKSYLQQCYI